ERSAIQSQRMAGALLSRDRLRGDRKEIGSGCRISKSPGAFFGGSGCRSIAGARVCGDRQTRGSRKNSSRAGSKVEDELHLSLCDRNHLCVARRKRESIRIPGKSAPGKSPG